MMQYSQSLLHFSFFPTSREKWLSISIDGQRFHPAVRKKINRAKKKKKKKNKNGAPPTNSIWALVPKGGKEEIGPSKKNFHPLTLDQK